MCQARVKYSTKLVVIIVNPKVAIFWVYSWQYNNTIQHNESVVFLGNYNRDN